MKKNINTISMHGEKFYQLHTETTTTVVLLAFSLTVKAATLTFISYLGMVRLFHLLSKGNQVLFTIW